VCSYFNIKRKRSGHLFQGRYKAILIDADEYAKELSRYIHLNPVRAGMSSGPEEYRWSSYLDYIGERKSPEWLKTAFILDYFGKGETACRKYRNFIEELIDHEYESPINGATAATILGSEEYVTGITARHLDGKAADRDVPAIKKLSARPTIDAIIEAAQHVVGNNRLSEKAVIYLCHKYSGARLKAIGERFGIGESAVTQSSRRFAQELERDKELNKCVEEMRINVGLSDV
jgi:putative transposase